MPQAMIMGFIVSSKCIRFGIKKNTFTSFPKINTKSNPRWRPVKRHDVLRAFSQNRHKATMLDDIEIKIPRPLNHWPGSGELPVATHLFKAAAQLPGLCLVIGSCKSWSSEWPHCQQNARRDARKNTGRGHKENDLTEITILVFAGVALWPALAQESVIRILSQWSCWRGVFCGD